MILISAAFHGVVGREATGLLYVCCFRIRRSVYGITRIVMSRPSCYFEHDFSCVIKVLEDYVRHGFSVLSVHFYFSLYSH